MDYLDLDSFRSRYSDITVTAVPNKELKLDKTEILDATNNAKMEPPPRVEIMPQSHKTTQQQQEKLTQEALDYATEYKQVLARLEYTKYVQAQLQMMSLSHGIGSSTFDSATTANIVDSYSNLLYIIAEMQRNLAPTTMGSRAPKERLLRDIAHARVLVRECILLLINNNQQQHFST